MLGTRCRLHDADTLDDVGVAHLPGPVSPGDLAATDTAVYVVVDVIENPPGSAVDAFCKVQPAHLPLVAR